MQESSLCSNSITNNGSINLSSHDLLEQIDDIDERICNLQNELNNYKNKPILQYNNLSHNYQQDIEDPSQYSMNIQNQGLPIDDKFLDSSYTYIQSKSIPSFYEDQLITQESSTFNQNQRNILDKNNPLKSFNKGVYNIGTKCLNLTEETLPLRYEKCLTKDSDIQFSNLNLNSQTIKYERNTSHFNEEYHPNTSLTIEKLNTVNQLTNMTQEYFNGNNSNEYNLNSSSLSNFIDSNKTSEDIYKDIRINIKEDYEKENDYEYQVNNKLMIMNNQMHNNNDNNNNSYSKIALCLMKYPKNINIINSNAFLNSKSDIMTTNTKYILSHRANSTQNNIIDKSTLPSKISSISYYKDSNSLGLSTNNIDFNQNNDGNGANINVDISSMEENNHNNENKENDMRSQIKKLFEFYANYGDKNNTTLLKLQKFHKMMIDCNIRDNILNQNKLDLMFVAENNHVLHLDFPIFYKLLVKIAKIKYRSLTSEKEAMQTLYINHLYPLYLQIYKSTNEFKKSINEPDIIVNENTVNLLAIASSKLLKIYNYYFDWDLAKNQSHTYLLAKQKIEHSLIALMRDFDIIPNLISKNTINLILADISNYTNNKIIENIKFHNWYKSNDIGNYFKFSKFIYLLIKVGSLTNASQYDIITHKPLTQLEKIYHFFEKMQIIAGNVSNLSTNKLNSQYIPPKISLAIPKDITINTNQKILDDKENELRDDHIGSFAISSSRISINKSILKQREARIFMSDTKTLSLQSNLSQEKSNKKILSLGQSYEKQLDRRTSSKSLIIEEIIKQNNRLIDEINESDLEFEDSISIKSQKKIFESNKESQRLTINEKILYNSDMKKSAMLEEIFEYYALLDESTKLTYLEYANFERILKDSGLMKDNQNDDDIDEPNRSQEPNNSSNKYDRVVEPDLAEDIFLECALKYYNESINSELPSNESDLIKRKKNSRENKKLNLEKMDYNGFLCAISIISYKLYPELEHINGVKIILDHYIFKLHHKIYKINQDDYIYDKQVLMNLIAINHDDEEIVNLIDLMAKALNKYYQLYSDSNGLMKFDGFYKFFKDYDIFNENISKHQLMFLFNGLNFIYARSKRILTQHEMNTKYQYNNQSIDLYTLIDALVICAMKIPISEPEIPNIKKIYYLLEKMNVSIGMINFKKNKGEIRESVSNGIIDLLQYIKNKNQSIFMEEYSKEKAIVTTEL